MSKAGSNAHARTIREDNKRFIFETCVAFGDLVFFEITSAACAAVCSPTIITREGGCFRISGCLADSRGSPVRARGGSATRKGSPLERLSRPMSGGS
jgi:hypothetical protein